MDLGADGFQTFRYVVLPNIATAQCKGCHTDVKNPLAKTGAENTVDELKAWMRTPKEMIAKKGKDTVSIPLPSVDIPHGTLMPGSPARLHASVKMSPNTDTTPDVNRSFSASTSVVTRVIIRPTGWRS